MADVAKIKINGTTYSIKDSVARNAAGGPNVAATKSAMTDKSKVYVYTGSESGMTNGNWYYWNGSAWTSGGIYQSSGLVTDATLTVSGMAADAKTVGDDITNLTDILNTNTAGVLDYINKVEYITFELSDGYIDYTDGTWRTYSDSGKYKATRKYIPVIPGETYRFINGIGSGMAGYAFYDKNCSYISGKANYLNDIVIPNNAYYIRFSDYNSSAIHDVSFIWVRRELTPVEELTLFGSCRFSSPLSNGYIDYRDGVYHNYGDGEFVCSDFIRIIKNDAIGLTLHINGSSGYGGYAFYDQTYTFLSGGLINITEIPNDAKYIRYTDHDQTKLHQNVYLVFYSKTFIGTDQLMSLMSKGEIKESPVLTPGYIDYNDGVFHNYSPNNTYACTEMLAIYPETELKINCTPNGNAGYAFYDSSRNYISGGIALNDIQIPNGSAYFRFSDYDSSGNHTGVEYTIRTKLLYNINKIVVSIQCIGDSVTEGMSTNGAHYARYGESPYPARLKTLLVDNGYDFVNVVNCGHGGERVPEIAARCGGFPCYISENIVVPGDGSYVSLGEATFVDGRTVGTKIKIPYADQDQEDYCVYFTQLSHDTNPIYIDGNSYTLRVGTNVNELRKTVADGNNTTISAGSLFFTNNDKTPSVNIFYGGINDGSSLTLKRWIDTMKKCGEANGGKYIVIGSTHALWNNWSDISGTAEEKYRKYKRAAVEAFGIHFIDMYKEFFEHAMDYSLSAGYFSDKTAEEIASIRTILNSHIVPKEFVYDKTQQGNVHLSEEGYHVFAMLIFDRIKALGYI